MAFLKDGANNKTRSDGWFIPTLISTCFTRSVKDGPLTRLSDPSKVSCNWSCDTPSWTECEHVLWNYSRGSAPSRLNPISCKSYLQKHAMGHPKTKNCICLQTKDVSGCLLVGKHVNERLAALWTACLAPTAQHKSILCSAVNVLSGYTCHNSWFHLEKNVSWLRKEHQA